MTVDSIPLLPVVEVLIHPCDPIEHPTYAGGYRWAVMVGGGPPTDLDHCVAASHDMSRDVAAAIGETVGSAVALGLRIMGVPSKYKCTFLGWDPIPSEADDRPLLRME